MLCLALIVTNLLWSAAWWSWYGGWSWGPRLLVPTIPMWLLPSAFLLQRAQLKQRLYIIASVVLISIISQLPGILVKDQELHQIKLGMLTPVEQTAAPSDYVTASILLKHKLVSHNELYRISEFGIPGDRELDLTHYRTFRGLNLWTELTARQFNKPAIRWLPLLGLLLVALLAVQTVKAVRADLIGNRLQPGDSHSI